tara:strand:+ start:169 stop:759 length:591 start_codon:yes stop_codon:yes gene_type:complete
MIIEKFFPTFVYGKDVQLDNNKLAQDIINWSNQDKGVQKTNYKGWHSTTDMANKPEYSPLVTELFRMQKEIYDNEHLDRNAFLGNMWANINPPGSMNQPHVHPNALFSGVYYVKSQPQSGRLKIYDPRPGIQTIMPVRKSGNPGKDLWREAHLEPIVGRIIMFPAWLWHSVEENRSNDIRISVSFNFVQDGFNGKL